MFRSNVSTQTFHEEGPVAKLASVLFDRSPPNRSVWLEGVLAHVSDPVAGLEEPFVAQHALESSLLPVNTADVPGEFVPAAEVRVTFIAFVWLHSTVNTHDVQG